MPVPMLPTIEPDTTRMAELTSHLRRSAAASRPRNRARRPLEHGTVHGYIHHGCRCEECKTAIREYRQQARGRSVPNHLHGHLSTYQYFGCRCDACKGAANEARAQYPRKRPRRRLRYFRNRHQQRKAAGGRA